MAKREEDLKEPIDTWEDMKLEMQNRFIPDHYTRELFNKLQKLTQGTKSVEEYYKEMELTMMRLKLEEKQEQTLARFFNGLNHPIKRIVEFLPYTTLWDLVHKATRAERQGLLRLPQLFGKHATNTQAIICIFVQAFLQTTTTNNPSSRTYYNNLLQSLIGTTQSNLLQVWHSRTQVI
jgi:hypothetical protein